MKVLVVDDSAILRRRVVRALRDAGYRDAEVIEAADGGEALGRLEEGGVTLVLSDLEMPRMGGEELLAHMQASPGLAAIPVVMITSEGGDDLESRLVAKGARGCLSKPVSADALARMVRPLLDR